jgi:hypothetical protein
MCWLALQGQSLDYIPSLTSTEKLNTITLANLPILQEKIESVTCSLPICELLEFLLYEQYM